MAEPNLFQFTMPRKGQKPEMAGKTAFSFAGGSQEWPRNAQEGAKTECYTQFKSGNS
jgi:hypothetical protein